MGGVEGTSEEELQEFELERGAARRQPPSHGLAEGQRLEETLAAPWVPGPHSTVTNVSKRLSLQLRRLACGGQRGALGWLLAGGSEEGSVVRLLFDVLGQRAPAALDSGPCHRGPSRCSSFTRTAMTEEGERYGARRRSMELRIWRRNRASYRQGPLGCGGQPRPRAPSHQPGRQPTLLAAGLGVQRARPVLGSIQSWGPGV